MLGGPYGSAQLAAAACTANPQCAGFNSAGYIKSVAWPLDQTPVDAGLYPGFCTHVKTATRADPASGPAQPAFAKAVAVATLAPQPSASVSSAPGSAAQP
ncbi:hypothetical protein HXX76_013550 [Chlamydomonas incerta]|uniref:Uncharacterized protein n=1 Tax=Chlamydomonas incerta TaxID=51695 RepID=A0A835SED5_CHLIN|nr:hypothetical protein HXX76_013550 [Chlamydomonas incerta]|eukprot:KAG2425708.1 hypothetical protein HXX76_013550 [Chlamydomonas incerta]